jgi:hypothetical protein
MTDLHAASPPIRDELVGLIQKRPMPASLRTMGIVFLVIGAMTFLYGVVTQNQRAWTAFHMNWLFFTIIASAGVVFAAVMRLTTARWNRAILRQVEGFVAFLPIAFVCLLLIIFVGKDKIYPWWDLVGTADLIPEKNTYLNHGFFWLRSLLVFGAITAVSLYFVWTSVRLDVGVVPEWGARWAAGLRAKMRAGFRDERRELHSTHSLQGKLAVVLVMLFGFGWVVMAWDHSMSLDYHFFSTMYGWQVFMGGWLAMLMLWSMLVRWWRNHLGAYQLMNDAHFHDIGKLCFAFTAFWGYITFAQYLVIWYGNLAEETHFFRLRLMDPWLPTTLATAALAFVIPFFGLLSVAAKTFTPTMTFFALSSLTGIWLARFTEVYPSVYTTTATALPLGFWEIGIALFYVGAFVLSYVAFMDAFPTMRVFLMTSPYRDEVQVPVNPETMEPLPAHE